AGGEKALAGLGAAARALTTARKPLAVSQAPPAKPQAAPVPITFTPEPEPVAELELETIPIHSHTDAASSSMLRAVPYPDDEVESEADPYELPPLALLNDPEPFPVEDHQQKLRDVASLLEQT